MSVSAGRLKLLRTVSEEQWREQVCRWARRAGWLVWFTWNSIHSPRGMPDLILVRPPRVIFAELKTETGRVSTDQDMGLGLLQLCPGVEVYIWRPHDEVYVREVLAAA